jgi:hypothetical protein
MSQTFARESNTACIAANQKYQKRKYKICRWSAQIPGKERAGTVSDQHIHPIDQIDQYLVDELPQWTADGDFYTSYWKQVESEDKLGCARGIVWAILFEGFVAVILAIVALMYWKFRLWPF